MYEFRRIFGNGKAVLFLALVACVNIIFFRYQASESKRATPQESYAEYPEAFGEHVRRTVANAASMQTFTLYQEADTFVHRNLVKTGSDYERLLYVVPEPEGDNEAVMGLLRYSLAPFLLLLCGLAIVLSFASERRKGLHLLVRSTAGGRGRLAGTRLLALAAGLGTAALILYGSLLVYASLGSAEGLGLNRPIQSLAEFTDYTGIRTIGEYFVLFVLARLMAAYAICSFFYFASSFWSFGAGMTLLLAGMAGEILLGRLLLVTDRLSVLRFVNAYTFLLSGTDYARYYNLNLFGFPIACGVAAAAGMALLGGSCSAGALLCGALRYPDRTSLLRRQMDRLRRFVSLHRHCPHLLGWEARKVMLSQMGLLILMVSLGLAYSSSRELSYVNLENKYELHWYEEFEGAVTEELVARVEEKQEEIAQRIERLEEQIERLRERIDAYLAEGRSTEFSSRQLADLEESLSEWRAEQRGLAIVHQKALDGLAYTRRTGREIYLIDTAGYEVLLSHDAGTTRRAHLYILAALIGSFSGILASEKTSNMAGYLRVLPRGRGDLAQRKILLVLLVSAPLALAVHLIQFLQIGAQFSYGHLSAPVQSIVAARSFPLAVSIGAFLALLYAGRALLGFAEGLAVMAVSGWCRNRAAAIAACVGAVVLAQLIAITLSIQ